MHFEADRACIRVDGTPGVVPVWRGRACCGCRRPPVCRPLSCYVSPPQRWTAADTGSPGCGGSRNTGSPAQTSRCPLPGQQEYTHYIVYMSVTLEIKASGLNRVTADKLKVVDMMTSKLRHFLENILA